MVPAVRPDGNSAGGGAGEEAADGAPEAAVAVDFGHGGDSRIGGVGEAGERVCLVHEGGIGAEGGGKVGVVNRGVEGHDGGLEFNIEGEGGLVGRGADDGRDFGAGVSWLRGDEFPVQNDAEGGCARGVQGSSVECVNGNGAEASNIRRTAV